MSDRIVVMNAGAIEQVGDANAIYRAPQTRFVADFVGDANLFTVPDAYPWNFRALDQTGPTGAGRIAVVRPEHVRFTDASSRSPDDVMLQGVVETVTDINGVTTIHVRVGNSTVMARTLGMETPVASGQTVHLAVPRQSVHFIEA